MPVKSSNWGTATWASVTPGGTGIVVSLRTGNTPTPDGIWTPFISVANSGSSIGGSSRYLQYNVELTTTAPDETPVFQGITILYSGH